MNHKLRKNRKGIRDSSYRCGNPNAECRNLSGYVAWKESMWNNLQLCGKSKIECRNFKGYVEFRSDASSVNR